MDVVVRGAIGAFGMGVVDCGAIGACNWEVTEP
jgi:hypothetical protein